MAFQYDKVYVGNALDILKSFPDNMFHVCVVSPPYWGKRAYPGNKPLVWPGDAEQCEDCLFEDEDSICVECGSWRGHLGQEPTVELYLEHVVLVFREVRRTLRDDGTLWLNMGDVYAHTGACGGGSAVVSRDFSDTMLDPARLTDKQAQSEMDKGTMSPGLKPKDLVGLPWRVAFALRDDGWWLRSDNIWAKTNAKPSPFMDRPATTHEYVFQFAAKGSYYYDPWAVLEPAASQKHSDLDNRRLNRTGKLVGRNRRTVWLLPAGKSGSNHVAVFNPEIPRLAILAGTSAKGACAICGAPLKRRVEKLKSDIKAKRSWEARAKTVGWLPGCECYEEGQEVPCLVLDPFVGEGTTAGAAEELGRNWVGIDLNPDSPANAEKLVARHRPVF